MHQHQPTRSRQRASGTARSRSQRRNITPQQQPPTHRATEQLGIQSILELNSPSNLTALYMRLAALIVLMLLIAYLPTQTRGEILSRVIVTIIVPLVYFAVYLATISTNLIGPFEKVLFREFVLAIVIFIFPVAGMTFILAPVWERRRTGILLGILIGASWTLFLCFRIKSMLWKKIQMAETMRPTYAFNLEESDIIDELQDGAEHELSNPRDQPFTIDQATSLLRDGASFYGNASGNRDNLMSTLATRLENPMVREFASTLLNYMGGAAKDQPCRSKDDDD